MAFQVVITEDAEHDLEDILTYVARHDPRGSADQVLDQILTIIESLAATPMCGTQPQELRMLGDQEYRQVLFEPYRLIYRVVGQQVVNYLIADGRRDMQTLLSRRLLGG
jgi:toxin ParE1/3/4